MSSGLHHKITHKKKATEFFGRFYYKNEIGIYFTNLTNSGFDSHFNGFQNGNAYFRIENPRVSYADGVFDESTNLVKFRNCCWYTNIDHGRRHQPLKLMTMAENYKHSKHKELRGRKDYIHYENYDAIEVPYTDAIPKDYNGVMGVPLTFLDKYCPEQFEIIVSRRGQDTM